MQNPENLDVFRESYTLAKDIYKAIENVKDIRLKGQLNAAATSVFSNLAEFAAFNNKGQKVQKLTTCLTEINETEWRFRFFIDVEEIEDNKEILNRIKKVRMMLMRLRERVD